jgi:hypothetical protein
MTNPKSLPTQVKALLKPSSMEFVDYMQATYPGLTLSRLLNVALEHYKTELLGLEDSSDD